MVSNRFNRTVHAVGSVTANTVELLDTVIDSKQTLWSEKNIEKMANVATVGFISAAGIDSLLDSDDSPVPSSDNAPDSWIDSPSAYALATCFDLDPDAVSNGMFVGDNGDLNDLIRADEDPPSVHLTADEYTRDIGLRDTFLTAHGWSELPDGYEVHHMPLSQGGPDSVDNKILISKHEHDIVTAAHREYYGWRS